MWLNELYNWQRKNSYAPSPPLGLTLLRQGYGGILAQEPPLPLGEGRLSASEVAAMSRGEGATYANALTI